MERGRQYREASWHQSRPQPRATWVEPGPLEIAWQALPAMADSRPSWDSGSFLPRVAPTTCQASPIPGRWDRAPGLLRGTTSGRVRSDPNVELDGSGTASDHCESVKPSGAQAVLRAGADRDPRRHGARGDGLRPSEEPGCTATWAASTTTRSCPRWRSAVFVDGRGRPAAVKAIVSQARTGRIGDGKVLVSPAVLSRGSRLGGRPEHRPRTLSGLAREGRADHPLGQCGVLIQRTAGTDTASADLPGRSRT